MSSALTARPSLFCNRSELFCQPACYSLRTTHSRPPQLSMHPCPTPFVVRVSFLSSPACPFRGSSFPLFTPADLSLGRILWYPGHQLMAVLGEWGEGEVWAHRPSFNGHQPRIFEKILTHNDLPQILFVHVGPMYDPEDEAEDEQRGLSCGHQPVWDISDCAKDPAAPESW